MGFIDTVAKAKELDRQNAVTAQQVQQEWAADQAVKAQIARAQEEEAKKNAMGLAYQAGAERTARELVNVPNMQGGFEGYQMPQDQAYQPQSLRSNLEQGGLGTYLMKGKF